MRGRGSKGIRPDKQDYIKRNRSKRSKGSIEGKSEVVQEEVARKEVIKARNSEVKCVSKVLY